MISFNQLLEMNGFDIKADTKMVRHTNSKNKDTHVSCDVGLLCRLGMLEVYQSYQHKKIFKCEYVISFIGLDNIKALFYGIYRVMNKEPGLSSEAPLPENFPYPDFLDNNCYYYDLKKVTGFEDLEERVVIEWNNSARSWCQWLIEKEVIEIYPKGYGSKFPGFLEIILSHNDLVKIIKNPDANREWHRMLASVAGVYLITDLKTGLQYVGSAYGNKGILGRWAQYADKPGGGNKSLEKLVSGDTGYVNNLQFTILHTLPKSLTKNEVIAYEVLYKNKLGSRAFGLNEN